MGFFIGIAFLKSQNHSLDSLQFTFVQRLAKVDSRGHTHPSFSGLVTIWQRRHSHRQIRRHSCLVNREVGSLRNLPTGKPTLRPYRRCSRPWGASQFLATSFPLCPSCGAASDRSPRREPWVTVPRNESRSAATERVGLGRLCRPCRGLSLFDLNPTARAVGYALSPLRGSQGSSRAVAYSKTEMHALRWAHRKTDQSLIFVPVWN